MTNSMHKFQRGLSIEGLVVVSFLLIIFSILGMKLIPPYMENKTIQNIFVAVANDPEMIQSPISKIQLGYNKRAVIDNITAINYTEIDIIKEGGSLYLSAEYEVRIPVVSNISF
ncbi:MAG: DUF4845 domain-containing protein, partial [Gallionella sp.]